ENKKLWQPATFFVKGGDKVGIIGPNGSGKTTFLKKIIEKSDENLYLSPAVKIGYFAQDMDVLDSTKTILENVKESSKQNETLIRTVLARLGFPNEDVYKKVNVLSGGEKVKASLAKIFVSDCNTLILDEPTNFLDIYALDALEELLKEYEGTILFVSHDRQFISNIATQLLIFEENQLIFFEGDYEEYHNWDHQKERDLVAEQLTKIELAITTVLSKLGDSMLTEDEKNVLEEEFQKLIKKKTMLEEEA